jgi:hypothetical protein
MVIITFLIIWSSIHKTQNSISSDFKCPNDYKTIEEYVESLAKWIRVTMDENPKITPDEIQKLRDEEIAEHKCSLSNWLSEDDMAMLDKSVTSLTESTTTTNEQIFNLNITIARTPYELSDYSPNGDYWIANYYSATTSSNQFNPKIIVLYVPIYSTYANSDGTEVTAKNVADNFAYHTKEDGFTLLNPLSFTDPKKPDTDIYVLTSYKLRMDEDYSPIFFTVIRKTKSGVFAVLYDKEIENGIDETLTRQKILEWLNIHTKYMEQIEKFDPFDFLHEDMTSYSNISQHQEVNITGRVVDWMTYGRILVKNSVSDYPFMYFIAEPDDVISEGTSRYSPTTNAIKNEATIKIIGEIIDGCFWNEKKYDGCVPWVTIKSLQQI